MGGLCSGSRGGDVQCRVKCECNRGKAKFGAASLVAELQRNVLFAERGLCECRHRHAQNHGALVDVQRNFRKCEFFEFAPGIGNFAAAEACGECGLEIGGDEIFFRFFASVDVEARANLHDHSNLERTAAAGGIERGVDFWLDHFAAGRNLRWCSGREGEEEREEKERWLKVES